MKRVLGISFLIAVFSAVFSFAQSQLVVQNQFQFKYLTIDQGLLNNNVRSICQDAEGFMWFVTKNGADRYDGKNIVHFKHDPSDSTTISSDDLKVVFSDSKGNLWFGSSGGLDLYNSNLKTFTTFSHPDLNQKFETVQAITEDKEGKLWIGSEAGLCAYDLNTSEIQFFSSQENTPHGLPLNHVLRLLVDRNNNVWFSMVGEGIGVYNQTDGSFRFFKNDPEDSSTLSGNYVQILYEDSKGNIWVGTYNNGLNRFVFESGSFIRTIPDPDNSYSTRVRAIFEDSEGNFFVGTRGGLYLRNDIANEFFHYAYVGHHFSNLSQNSILCSFIDRTGSLWIGTFSGGVNYTNLNRKGFIHYKSGKGDKHLLSESNIYAITEDPQGNLWVGSDNGLNFLDRTSSEFRYYYNDPDDPASLSYNDIKALEWDKKGNLWIGTNRGGLNYYDVRKDKFISYKHDPDDVNSLSGDKVYGLLCDINNNLWIITSSNTDHQYSNIDILPDGSDRFIHLDEYAYFGLDQNNKGDIYIGGINGFWIFSGEDSTYSFVENRDLISFTNTVREDSRGIVWIGSSKGLTRYNQEDKTFVSFSESNGYPINEVFGILEDDTKSLWVSTNAGLIKITNIVEDYTDIEFRVFDKEDGLQSKQFNYNAFHKSKSGEMAFGGINGFNTFYPNEIIEDTVPPNVILTDLIIYNTSTPIGKKVEDRVILEKSISATEEIKLGPKQNVFTLEFAALHYANPEKNSFKYKLEGFDKEWQYKKASNNFATYTNLSVGEYTFRVTGANNDGVWNKNGIKLRISVLPAWWQTILFRIALIFTIMGLVIGFYYIRLNQLRVQKERLIRMVEERTSVIEEKNTILRVQSDEMNEINTVLEERQQQVEEQAEELRAQSEELSKTNESLYKLNSTKDKFFSIIAHDLKNPFASILGFCEVLILRYDKYDDEKRKHLIGVIEGSAKNIYKLLENLLQWSRSQTGNLKMMPEEFNLNDLIKDIETLLENSFKAKNLNFKKSIPPGLIVFADRNMLYTVIRNLITNAIKFSDSGEIFLEAKTNQNELKLEITDKGVGIRKEVLDKLFEIDKSKSTEGTRGESGTGLGLIICKEFIDKHEGSIGATSIPGEGSTFFFTIPYPGK